DRRGKLEPQSAFREFAEHKKYRPSGIADEGQVVHAVAVKVSLGEPALSGRIKIVDPVPKFAENGDRLSQDGRRCQQRSEHQQRLRFPLDYVHPMILKSFMPWLSANNALFILFADL